MFDIVNGGRNGTSQSGGGNVFLRSRRPESNACVAPLHVEENPLVEEKSVLYRIVIEKVGGQAPSTTWKWHGLSFDKLILLDGARGDVASRTK